MAVQKTSASRLRKDELPYTTVTNKTVEIIRNTDALAIWTFLQTKPEGWVVRAKNIQEHFGIGRDKYRNAMKYLAGIGLISYVHVNDEAGHLQGTDILVHYEPTEGLKNRPSVKPTIGESAPLVIEGGVSNGMKDSNAQPDGLSDAFEKFWNAGMVKVGKAKAKAKFERLVKGLLDPMPFAEMLANDVKARLSAGVFGFDRLHPITYLNGERWTDEIVGDLPDNVHSFHDRRPAPSTDDCGGKVYIPAPANGGAS